MLSYEGFDGVFELNFELAGGNVFNRLPGPGTYNVKSFLDNIFELLILGFCRLWFP
jgi:hypothetical protein